MIKIRCLCGKVLDVDDSFAGKRVRTSCCNAEVMIPGGDRSTQESPSSQKSTISCTCGQPLSVNLTAGQVIIQCPKCQTRLKVGASPAAPQPPAPSLDLASIPNEPQRTFTAPQSYAQPKAKKRTRKRKASDPDDETSSGELLQYWLYGPAFVIVGSVMLYFIGYKRFGETHAQWAWSETQMQITATSVSHELHKVRVSKRRSVERRDYIPRATYTYEVDGRSFESQFSGGWHAAKQDADAWLRTRTVGTMMTVYYNPGKPEESTVGQSLSGGIATIVWYWALVLLALFFFLTGLLMTFVAIHETSAKFRTS